MTMSKIVLFLNSESLGKEEWYTTGSW